MLPPLTEREKRILFLIRTWQFKKRYSPSCGDVADTFQVKKQTISHVFTSLRKKGYIEMSEHKSFVHRRVLMPAGMEFPWGNEQLPDELFDHMKKPPVNGNSLTERV